MLLIRYIEDEGLLRVRAHEKREHAQSKGASGEWAASIERVQLGSRCILEKGQKRAPKEVHQELLKPHD